MHRELAISWRAQVHGALGVPLDQLARSAGKTSPKAHSGLPDRVSEAINRICVPWRASKSRGYLSSSIFLPSSHTAYHSFLTGWERSGSLWWCHAHLGKPDACSYVLISPNGRNHGPKGLPWPWDVPPWERDDTGKAKLFLLPSSMGPISDFVFKLQSCCNIFSGLSDFHKGILTVGDYQNMCSLEEDN